MPLKRCGKDGWKWGDSGHCYTGPGAKKKAIKQGLAIEGPNKFAEKASDDEIELLIATDGIPFSTKTDVALARKKFLDENQSNSTN